MNKIVSIQLLRGIACLLVLQVHVLPNLYIFSGKYSGSIGVDLFFVISGFIIASTCDRLAKKQPVRNYLINRFSRVWPFYLLATIVTAVVRYIFHDPFTLLQLAKGLLFLPQVSDPVLFVGWTLNHEILFYLFVGFFLMFKIDIVVIGVVFILFIFLFSILNLNGYIFKFFAASINYTFVFGLLAYRFSSHVSRIFKNRFLMVSSILIFIAIPFFSNDTPLSAGNLEGYLRDTIFFNGSYLSLPRAIAWGVPSLLIFSTLVANEEWLQRCRTSILFKIGNASYTLYLIQGVYVFLLWGTRYEYDSLVGSMLFVGTVAAALYIYPLENYIGNYSKHLLKRIFVKTDPLFANSSLQGRENAVLPESSSQT
jgi:exopolysaccharide production protein ExoZ